MEVPYLLMADHASADASGKINVLGLFGRINAPNVPVVHYRLFLVANLVFSPSEAGKTRQLTLRLMSDAANEVFVQGPIDFEVPKHPLGQAVEVPLIMEVNGLRLPDYGTYTWFLEVDKDTKQSRNLEVVPKGK